MSTAVSQALPVTVSVVLCTYNRAHLLRGALEALAAQSTGLAWELIVVDNNSTDDTRAVAAELAPSVPCPVRYVFEQAQGLSRARNRGVLESTGAIIAFMDDDVRPAKDWVDAIAQSMGEWSADAVGGRIVPLWQSRPPSWIENSVRVKGHCYGVMEFPEARRLSFPMTGLPQIWGSSMAFRREALGAAEPFNPLRGVTGARLWRGEEVEVLNRLLEQGRRVVYDPRIVVWHEIPVGRMERRYVRRLFFHTGEGESLAGRPMPGPRVLGVPRWLVRMVVERFLVYARSRIRGRADALDCELDLIEDAGRAWGLLRRHLSGSRRP